MRRPTFIALLSSTLLSLFFRATAIPVHAAEKGLVGDWREPGGAVIRIAPCGPDLCARLVSLTSDAPTKVDARNPDPAQQTKPLCGLVIGTSFHPAGGNRASNGTLYDPRSGRTYHGEMMAEGDQLQLRGYVGMRLFGRTQTWTRATEVAACSAPDAEAPR